MAKKILVADDDQAILDALHLMLEEEGYAVETTDNGAELLEIKTEVPDLVLLDVWMSGQDGRQICSQLKKREDTRNIPVIMISANQDTVETVFEAGADDFLAKPFEISELLKKVDRYLANK